MKLTRRDILKLAAGSAVGIMVTPLPWKMLDDSAIWSQNWPWIPQPPRGETTFKTATCALCPSGCGVRARCVQGTPVRLSGLPWHPYGKGALCPVGLAGHHLPYHPLRVLHPLKRVSSRSGVESTTITSDEAFSLAASAIKQAVRDGAVAILDMRPGRSISSTYASFLSALGGGMVVLPPAVEDGMQRTASAIAGDGAQFGLDLEHAGMIVSFGTPLFDGWGTPGRMAALAASHTSTERPSILAVSPLCSQTAQIATPWLPIKPGTETAMALGIAHVILRDQLVDAKAFTADKRFDEFSSLAREFAPERVSTLTGIPAERIVEVAHMMCANRPTLVLGGGDAASGPLGNAEQSCLVALNAMLGSIDAVGGLVSRGALPAVSGMESNAVKTLDLQDVPNHSISVLIVDGAENGNALPWPILESKLTNERATVISFASTLTGLTRQAGIVIPSPAPYESIEELVTPPDAPVASYAISTPLFSKREGSVEPGDSIAGIAGVLGLSLAVAPIATAVKTRCNALLSTHRGSVVGESGPVPAVSLVSSDQLFEQLSAGAVWMDEPSKRSTALRNISFFPEAQSITAIRAAAEGRASGNDGNVIVIPVGWKNASATGQLSPVLSKLYQESDLRASSGMLLVNPATARQCGVADGEQAMIRVGNAMASGTIHEDPSAMPGVVVVPVGPDPEVLGVRTKDVQPATLLCHSNDCSWRIARATLVRG